MKLTRFLFLIALLAIFQNCNNGPSEPQSEVAQRQDTTELAHSDAPIAVPSNFKVDVERLNAVQTIDFPSYVLVKKYLQTTLNGSFSSDLKGKVEIQDLIEPEILKFSAADFYPISYTFEEVDFLYSMKPYMKFFRTHDPVNFGYVTGKVFKRSDSRAKQGVIVSINAAGQIKKDTTDANGLFSLNIPLVSYFTITYSTTNSVILKVEDVQDTVQLDVYLDDRIDVKRDSVETQ